LKSEHLIFEGEEGMSMMVQMMQQSINMALEEKALMAMKEAPEPFVDHHMKHKREYQKTGVSVRRRKCDNKSWGDQQEYTGSGHAEQGQIF